MDTSMRRRTFLKTLILAGASLPTFAGKNLFATEIVPHAKRMPVVPFDAPAGTWTLAVLPDTQNMADSFPAEYDRQTAWIVAHQKTHNIIFVAHEGDVVDNNSIRRQWENAQKSMRILTDAGIPYALLPGNHDLGCETRGTAQDRSTLLNDYFLADDYRHSEAFGLFETGKMENSWHHFTAPTGKYLLLALEFGPRNAVVDWADGIVSHNPDRKVIVVTHSHTYYDNTIYDWQKNGRGQQWNPKAYGIGKGGKGDANDSTDLWNKLLKKQANIFLVLSGHVLKNGTGYTIGIGDRGQKIHQILANYQAAVEPHQPYAGGGFLRLMQFYPDGVTVQVKSYSPWLDQWLTSSDQQFPLKLT